MKIKEFDCVQMKRQGYEIIYDEIKNMTIEEQLEYWKNGTEQLKKKKLSLRKSENYKNTK